MDQAELNKLRALAEKNGIDFDAVHAAVDAGTMPEGLRRAMETAMGELAAFSPPTVPEDSDPT